MSRLDFAVVLLGLALLASALAPAVLAADAPPDLEALLEAAPGDDVDGSFGEERRQSAMRHAALGYGSQGGLARRGWEIDRLLEELSAPLSRLYRFDALMLREGGFVIVPPAVTETRDAFRVAPSGAAAAASARVLRIAAPERLTASAPRWREFLGRSWPPATPPVAVLWPRDATERDLWERWVGEGWAAGRDMADRVFAEDLARLTNAFEGLARWHRLHLSGMVSPPQLQTHAPAVSGGGDLLHVGTSAIAVTEPAALNPAARLWQPTLEPGR